MFFLLRVLTLDVVDRYNADVFDKFFYTHGDVFSVAGKTMGSGYQAL